ncbi:MAG: aminodeoxychorismate/anthranilate synthase component II [Saprospiraceae bacterium]|nr:aminodeoxychorismate/anthranilate synthase component II [Saprospiraceae bacterium]
MISTCNKILLIDNKDSFTFNLVHLFESLGCKVTISDSFDLKTDCFLDYRQIVFSPGPGLPEDFPVMSHILKSISKETKVLGVCLGHQSIAQYFGAKLFKQDKVQHGQQKRILKSESCQNTSLQYLPESFNVGVYHSWAVVPESIPKDLLITCV